MNAVDWQSIFVPTVSPLEIILRGTLVYLGLFLMFRFLSKRDAGAIGIADLLVVVLVADASQNAMSADYKSITDGLLLVGTILFWNYAIDWLAYRFPSLEQWLYASPVPLVRNGRMLHRNMRREMISQEELMTQLRKQGVDDLAQVAKACMEGDGSISVIKKKQSSSHSRPERKPIA